MFSETFRVSRPDIDNSGYVSDYELQDLFREASFSLPGYKVREIMNAFSAGDTNKDERISFEEFVSVSSHLMSCVSKKKKKHSQQQETRILVWPTRAVAL